MKSFLVALALLVSGCRALQGALIGGTTGAAATKTPEGAGVGALAGFLVGAWDDITSAVSAWWKGLWGGDHVPPPSAGNHIVQWIVLLVLFGFLVKFAYHFTWDSDFRAHIFTLFSPKLRRKKKPSAATPP